MECPFPPASLPSTELRDLSSHLFKLVVFVVAMKLPDSLDNENNTKFSSPMSFSIFHFTTLFIFPKLLLWYSPFCMKIVWLFFSLGQKLFLFWWSLLFIWWFFFFFSPCLCFTVITFLGEEKMRLNSQVASIWLISVYSDNTYLKLIWYLCLHAWSLW